MKNIMNYIEYDKEKKKHTHIFKHFNYVQYHIIKIPWTSLSMHRCKLKMCYRK